MEQNFYLVTIFFLISNAVVTIAGFGSIAVGLSFASRYYPIQDLVPIIVPIDMFSSVFIFYKYFRHIDWKLLKKEIMPQVGIGFILALVLNDRVDITILKKLFGIFILGFAARRLHLSLLKQQATQFVKSPLLLIPAGFIQGVFASGGPMIVTYLSTKIHEKNSFRSTLAVLWVTLNSILIMNFIRIGKINETTLQKSLVLVAPVLIGISIGEFLQKKVSQSSFKILVYSLLIFASISLLT